MNQCDSAKSWLVLFFDSLWQIRFLRFLFIGSINTLFSYSIYTFLLFLGLNYAIANLFALVTGIIFSFKTQGALVFNNSSYHLFWRFILCWVMIYGVNITFIASIMALGLDAYLAGALAIPPVVLISYLAQKYLVFRP